MNDGIIHARPEDVVLVTVDRAGAVAELEVKAEEGFGLDAIVALPGKAGIELTYVLTDLRGARAAVRTLIHADDLRVPTVVPLWPQADWLERRIRDLFGVTPTKHPRAARLVRHSHWPKGYYPLALGHDAPVAWVHDTVSKMQLPTVKGEGIHEIPVGPIHAGIIEPGHFRFFADGERIIALEPRLFYVHRGVERLMRGSAVHDGAALAEVVSGDTAIGHAWAYCEAVESALGIEVDDDAQALRAFALEAERIACHIGDLGGILNDIAFGWAHAQCQGLREELLRAYADAFGHRLMRGLVVPGGVARHAENVSAVLARVAEVVGVVVPLMDALGRRAAVLARTRSTGQVSRETALTWHASGVAARASGVARDRRGSTAGPYEGFEPVVAQGGDVEARFVVRLNELGRSVEMMTKLADQAARARAVDSTAVLARAERTSGEGLGAVEGWRGECLHWAVVDKGRIRAWYPRDPSALNWALVPLAVTGEVVPDFPLVNKSFNLSYAGNDL